MDSTMLTQREEKSKKDSVGGGRGGCILQSSSSPLYPSILPGNEPRCFLPKIGALALLLLGALLLAGTAQADEPLAPLGTLPMDQPDADHRDIDEGWIYDSLLEPTEDVELWVPESNPVEWIEIDPE